MKIEDNCPTIEDCIIEWLHKDLNRIEIFLSVAIEEYIKEVPMIKKDNFRTFEECILEWLHDPENAKAYLEVILEGYAESRDLKYLLRSLGYIATAKGDTLELADSSEVNQESLDRLLGKDANPSLEQVIEILGYTRLEDSGEPVPSF